jgi:hypothetical protein
VVRASPDHARDTKAENGAGVQVSRRAAGPVPSRDVPAEVAETLRSPGRPLAADARAFFEPRLGEDLGGVRVHTDDKASRSARAVDALAYTVGRNIVFDAGRYAPATTAGRCLLAHELTHVLQQRGAAPGLQRQATPGTSVYSEHISDFSTNTGEPGVWSGHMRREERTPEGALIHTGMAPVRYDENACSVAVPMTVSFRNATLADVQNCRPHWDQPAPTRLPANVDSGRFQRIREEYLRSLNQDLNGWYAVRFEGCERNPCHGREMPIEVRVTEVSGGARADYEVAIANLEGRSCVDDANYVAGGATPATVLLYASGLDSGTMSHEGGHMALGHGDEYHDPEQPGVRSETSVREGDYSRMASENRFGRFALMHERHYAFVPAFLNHVRPGCNAQLVEVARPAQVEIRIAFGAGYAGFLNRGGVSSGEYLGLGLELGLPLSRLREWEFILGVHGRMLAELEDAKRIAFLLGVRFGLEHTFTPSLGGFTAGAFGEGGRSWLSGGGSQDGTYLEGGGYLGYASSPTRLLGGGNRGIIRVEAARGALFSDAPAAGTGARDSQDYFRVGVSAAWQF